MPGSSLTLGRVWMGIWFCPVGSNPSDHCENYLTVPPTSLVLNLLAHVANVDTAFRSHAPLCQPCQRPHPGSLPRPSPPPPWKPGLTTPPLTAGGAGPAPTLRPPHPLCSAPWAPPARPQTGQVYSPQGPPHAVPTASSPLMSCSPHFRSQP